MNAFSVTAIGRDRPGIVAAISGALLGLEGNVEDSRMANLGGQFAVMLLVSLPGEAGEDELQAALEPVAGQLGLDAVTVAAVSAGAPRREPATHVLSVYGADHPGIVHAVTSALAGAGANITDLETRVAGAAGSPVYVMQIELSVSDADAVERAIERAGEQAGVEVALRELGTEAL